LGRFLNLFDTDGAGRWCAFTSMAKAAVDNDSAANKATAKLDLNFMVFSFCEPQVVIAQS